MRFGDFDLVSDLKLYCSFCIISDGSIFVNVKCSENSTHLNESYS